jgi:hypothetical protein
VYRLVVVYPPTSHYEAEGEWDLDWEPENWERPPWNGDPDADDSFHWPRANRRYLSRTEAERRAGLLMSYGAKVSVERSLPVVWESDILEAVKP